MELLWLSFSLGAKHTGPTPGFFARAPTRVFAWGANPGNIGAQTRVFDLVGVPHPGFFHLTP
jgi:hypothetical protein